MVIDENGDKMSKVKGNVIDPLDLIYGATFADMAGEDAARRARGRGDARSSRRRIRRPRRWATASRLGADAVRFTLSTFPPSNKRIALAPKRIEGYRHFANKIWNASRLLR